MDHDLVIERAGAERIGELEPLWAALQRHRAERRLAGLDVLFVEVSAIPAHESAIRFYERRGVERAAIKFAGRIRRPADDGSEEGS
jgi:hypothetical protein